MGLYIVQTDGSRVGMAVVLLLQEHHGVYSLSAIIFLAPRAFNQLQAAEYNFNSCYFNGCYLKLAFLFDDKAVDC